MLYGLFTDFTDNIRVCGQISLQTQNTVVSFVCFGFELVRQPTHCPDDRAL